ncbi:MAG: hypothetical protein AB7K24_30810 [Gemmataceae bacterium]
MIKRLDKAGIPDAVMGAVNLHGARRTTDVVDVLLDQEGLAYFKKKLRQHYQQVEGRSRRFTEVKSGVTIDF